MKYIVLGLGIAAAAFGVFASFLAMTTDLLMLALDASHQTTYMAIWGLPVSAVGFYGARLAGGRPILASFVMSVVAVAGLLVAGWFYAVPAALWFIGSGVSFLWRNEGQPVPPGRLAQERRGATPLGDIRSVQSAA